jgi:hypothetical protein
MKSDMKKLLFLVVLGAFTLSGCTKSSGYEKLDEWTQIWKEGQQTYFGYPANQQSALHEFYEWYVSTGMDRVNLNNAGDPMTDNPWKMSTQAFEREVIEFFKRPTPEICRKYNLALGYDDQFGGELAHVVVMQHVTKAKIDGFIKALEQEMP